MAGAVAAAATTRSSALQAPGGPIVEKLHQALDSKVTVQFVDTPIEDVIEFLADLTNIPIIPDQHALRTDAVVTLNLKAATVGSTLQAVEDQNRALQFVVREYGILLTDRHYAAEAGFLPISEFARSKPDATAGLPTPNKPSAAPTR